MKKTAKEVYSSNQKYSNNDTFSILDDEYNKDQIKKSMNIINDGYDSDEF